MSAAISYRPEGFAGSFFMGLRTLGTVEPPLAVLWLGGVVLIAAAGLEAGLLPGPELWE
jgi:hypothetical protein